MSSGRRTVQGDSPTRAIQGLFMIKRGWFTNTTQGSHEGILILVRLASVQSSTVYHRASEAGDRL